MTAITPLKCLTSDKCSLISAPDQRLLAQIFVILTVITRSVGDPGDLNPTQIHRLGEKIRPPCLSYPLLTTANNTSHDVSKWQLMNPARR